MASTGVEGDASPGLPVESQPDTVPDPPGQGTAMAGCTFEEARFAGAAYCWVTCLTIFRMP